MPNKNHSTNGDRFARQGQRTYSGQSSLVTIAIIVIIIGTFFFMYLTG